MKLNITNLVLLSVIILLFPYNTVASRCNQTCGSYNLEFPFGFSPGCDIQLNCSSNGTMFLGDFSVQSVGNESILVNLPPMCNRPVAELSRLFTRNYAPTSHNAILLQNCSSPSSNCWIPSTMVQTTFQMHECGDMDNDSISCYSELNNATSFIDHDSLTSRGCQFLFSGISMESLVSLDVQVLRLGWWMRGEIRCSEHANVTFVTPPLGVGNFSGYRCNCKDGYRGDGFRDGSGCRRASLVCNPSKYLSGQCGGKTRIGVLVGGVASGALLMIGLGLVIRCIQKKSKLRSRSKRSRQLCETTGITIPVHAYKEMEKATDFFSEKRRLGNGAYGTVYSGKLNSNEWVAVKRIKHRDAETIEQVINEIKLLSAVSHPNLVRLLGCSIDHEEQILVYEYMPNGTLFQHLQREKGGVLPWPVRLAIAAETAQAISYLHNALHPPIYHRDIKSSNILLDYNYKSKVADFGLSRLGLIESSHISTAPQGTPGYLDPEYHQHFQLSDKSDVYSFGVVLVEIITAMKVVDFNRPQNEINLASLAVGRIGRGVLHEIIDPFMDVTQDAWALLSLHKTAELAFRCLAFHRDMRPSMLEVASELELIKLSKWTDSSAASSCSSSSNLSEKPLKLTGKKQEFNSVAMFGSTSSLDSATDFSPSSVRDSWRSDKSSPSSNSLLNRITR